MERLHGVDDADVGTLAARASRRPSSSSVSARISTALGAAEPRGAQLHLRGRLLAGDEQRPPAPRDRAERAQEERRLADAGLAADEDERRGHEAAAEHAVELGDAGRDPRRLLDLDVDEPQQRLAARRRRRRVRPTTSSTSVPNALQPGHFPSQRPASRAAFRARRTGLRRLRHRASLGVGFRRQSCTKSRRSLASRAPVDKSPGDTAADDRKGRAAWIDSTR